MKLEYHFMPVRLAILILASAVSVIACGPEQARKNEVINVVLKEFKITTDIDHIKAGLVTFRAKNIGKEEHELVIVKSDLPIDKLPMQDGVVMEEKVGDLVGEIEEFLPNTIEEVTYKLTPGRYIMFCNVVEHEHGSIESHYMEGMRIAIIVE